MNDEPADDLPDGDYAIAEVLGHRTLVGRCQEVDRFGTKMLGIEPIFRGKLLPMVFVGGASLYAFTPCTKEQAIAHAPTHDYQLPGSLLATLGPAALPRPDTIDYRDGGDDEE